MHRQNLWSSGKTCVSLFVSLLWAGVLSAIAEQTSPYQANLSFSIVPGVTDTFGNGHLGALLQISLAEDIVMTTYRGDANDIWSGGSTGMFVFRNSDFGPQNFSALSQISSMGLGDVVGDMNYDIHAGLDTWNTPLGESGGNPDGQFADYGFIGTGGVGVDLRATDMYISPDWSYGSGVSDEPFQVTLHSGVLTTLNSFNGPLPANGNYDVFFSIMYDGNNNSGLFLTPYTSVPEPSITFLIGICGMRGFSRRRRKSSVSSYKPTSFAISRD